ncbi:hypothetical protein [Levilactobacillus zymae]|uniref:Uncharacterized protein n=1 Tax=Levilactobacillus zymae TaxID=267363 RepID=A0A1Y6JU93_9LACO|nr:hypothetical protein [Levilactobacillus zymae]KRL15164.1 hypothetical protein FD38_GL000978 [Levilactobacillus zymae DSM 19395]QFR61453.1 hypothetical protein LZ395_07965 [Levilactobacillus zymae]GEO71668.1 hypothetical protein LZY01_08360 [Levilactobacillus zymae]SMS13527.1 hypothetical protein LZ3411_0477 [Levilactobacillus zymae]
MSRAEIMTQLRRLVQRLRWLSVLQLVPDTLVIYGILQLGFSQGVVSLFNVGFTRQKAGLVVILFILIDLCVTGIRYNDRMAGHRLIGQLKGHLDESESALIKQFEKFK